MSDSKRFAVGTSITEFGTSVTPQLRAICRDNKLGVVGVACVAGRFSEQRRRAAAIKQDIAHIAKKNMMHAMTKLFENPLPSSSVGDKEVIFHTSSG